MKNSLIIDCFAGGGDTNDVLRGRRAAGFCIEEMNI